MADPTPVSSILKRFAHLLSAQGAEGLFSGVFFLYLAWLDATTYGQVMIALAAGSMIMKAVQFGLYYPLVERLGKARPEEVPGLLNQVTLIKAMLLLPTAAALGGLVVYRGYAPVLTWVLFLVSLGFALEAMAETFFSDLRVRGRQDVEARIKIVASVASYGYGFGAAALGFHPALIGLFKLISGLILFGFGARPYFQNCIKHLRNSLEFKGLGLLFRAASVFAVIEILGTLYNKTNLFFLEGAVGSKGVAFYSATWNVIDPISILASNHFLGWVIFPLLATLWVPDRTEASRLIRASALWLLAVAFPIMFVLHVESDVLIGLLYRNEYQDAVWMQRYLVWTILLSFENNLFAYVMMVAGSARTLLVFAVFTTALNLALNVALVKSQGLLGACLVILLTKLTMTLLTGAFCQLRFNLFRLKDFFFPLALAAGGLVFFLALEPLITRHAAAALVLGGYALVLWKSGVRFLGGTPTAKKAG